MSALHRRAPAGREHAPATAPGAVAALVEDTLAASRRPSHLTIPYSLSPSLPENLL
ncbi:hypothetical protein AB8A21_38695 [Streptomyces sp. BF23-18]|uniref:hypothetical protein n=1 Tax=Streptomyces sp. BF23-18 TaxID=3240282 RepID=UPI0034E4A4B4